MHTVATGSGGLLTIPNRNPGDAWQWRIKTSASDTTRSPRKPSRSDSTSTMPMPARSALYLKRGKSTSRGYVCFPPEVTYENFTYEFNHYPSRVDVESWDNFVPDGVTVKLPALPRCWDYVSRLSKPLIKPLSMLEISSRSAFSFAWSSSETSFARLTWSARWL